MEQIITKDMWVKDGDLWYVHIKTPFECTPDTETILEIEDSQDYIDEHKDVFEALNNGETKDNEVIISCDIEPNCDIKVSVKTLEEAGGRIMYDKDGNPEYIPDKSFDMFSAMSMLGGMPSINPEIDNQVIDAEVKEKTEC